MRVFVLSRANTAKYLETPHPNTLVISISDINRKQNILYDENNAFVYRWYFDDEEDDSVRTNHFNGQPMTQEQANDIAFIVNDYISNNWIDEILVHCQAGISRSPAVAAAIMLAINGDDSEIWNNGLYSPNMTCYRKTLKAFGIDIGEEIKAKFEKQLEAWLKAQEIYENRYQESLNQK